MPPTVSVVIPTYNRTDLLPRAIESVLGQTYGDFECLVVDDASTEDTRSVVERFDDERLRYFEHDENRGASAARNTGIDHARGEYVAFLDDDDEWRPPKLEKQVPVLDDAPPEVALVYCWMNFYKQSGELHREHHPTLEGDVFPHVLDSQRIGGCPTLLVRRAVVEEVGGFDESLPRGNDGDFIRRICRDYEVRCVPEVLVNVYVDHGNERITRYDETGIRNAIHGSKTKLEKFETALQRYPTRHANIYADIAYFHGLLGEWEPSRRYYRRAFRTAPFSWKVHRRIASTIKHRIEHAL